MGAAKRRGTREQRVAQALAAGRVKIPLHERKRVTAATPAAVAEVLYNLFTGRTKGERLT
jgi:hypothetical protein